MNIKKSKPIYIIQPPIEYGRFLCDDVADAFVVGVLLPAARYEQDIIVDGAVSDRLYYNINSSILYTLANVWNKKRVKLIAKEVKPIAFEGNAVGCGCSLGIDSFAAMLQHLNNPELPQFNITHLTYFNVGAMGDKNLEKAKQSYAKDLELVKQFAAKVNLPIVQLPDFHKISSLPFGVSAKDFCNCI